MAWTSPTTVNWSAGFSDGLPWISEVTNFWFGRMLMIAIFFIMATGYLKAKQDDFIGAFAVSSYTTFVLGLIFWVIGLVNGLDFGLICGVVLVASILLLTQNKTY